MNTRSANSLVTCLSIIIGVMTAIPIYSQDGSESKSTSESVAENVELPEIELWYGDRQTFGRVGKRLGAAEVWAAKRSSVTE